MFHLFWCVIFVIIESKNKQNSCVNRSQALMLILLHKFVCSSDDDCGKVENR